jgi:hypothetical protein
MYLGWPQVPKKDDRQTNQLVQLASMNGCRQLNFSLKFLSIAQNGLMLAYHGFILQHKHNTLLFSVVKVVIVGTESCD